MSAEYFVACDAARELVRLGKGRFSLLEQDALKTWQACSDAECAAMMTRCLPGVDADFIAALTLALRRWCTDHAFGVRVLDDSSEAYAQVRDYRVTLSRYALPR